HQSIESEIIKGRAEAIAKRIGNLFRRDVVTTHENSRRRFLSHLPLVVIQRALNFQNQLFFGERFVLPTLIMQLELAGQIKVATSNQRQAAPPLLHSYQSETSFFSWQPLGEIPQHQFADVDCL